MNQSNTILIMYAITHKTNLQYVVLTQLQKKNNNKRADCFSLPHLSQKIMLFESRNTSETVQRNAPYLFWLLFLPKTISYFYTRIQNNIISSIFHLHYKWLIRTKQRKQSHGINTSKSNWSHSLALMAMSTEIMMLLFTPV